MNKRYLVLANGSIYSGLGFGANKDVHSEIVFSTGMTGYQETMSDPSYYGQMMVFSYPMIGNYGINRDDFEHFKPTVDAIIVHEAASHPSNFRSQMSLGEYAKKWNLPGIQNIGTRALVKEIRENGSMKAVISDRLDSDHLKKLFQRPIIEDAMKMASVKSPYQAPNDGYHIALIDYGMKNSIMKALTKRNIDVTVFPADVDADDIINHHPDGILLSNGPGDPKDVSYTLPTIQRLEKLYPLMGICFGHQLLALANGGDTYKMKFGHRGFNHAVRDATGEKSIFTSQNHGYAVSGDSISNTDLEVTYQEINDGTVEGLKLVDYPVFSVQFHPDASPGPHDADFIFDKFIQMIKRNGGIKNAQKN